MGTFYPQIPAGNLKKSKKCLRNWRANPRFEPFKKRYFADNHDYQNCCKTFMCTKQIIINYTKQTIFRRHTVLLQGTNMEMKKQDFFVKCSEVHLQSLVMGTKQL